MTCWRLKFVISIHNKIKCMRNFATLEEIYSNWFSYFNKCGCLVLIYVKAKDMILKKIIL